MQHAQSLYAETYARTPQIPLPRAGRAADDASGPVSLARAIDRLEEVIDEETAALRARVRVDLKDFNTRKSHGLLELTRALRVVDPGGTHEGLRARLTELRGKLEQNRAAIALHLEAVREISATIAEAMQEAESDGTYSEAAARVRRKP